VEKNKPYDFPESFYDFAMMPKFEQHINVLSNLAEPEDWDYKNTPTGYPHPILRNYLTYTYRRVAEEKKINVTLDENYCCWNTGLITKMQEPIYMLLNKNYLNESQPYWHFHRFARKGEWEMNRFASLPEMAHYFDDPSFLVLDTRKDIRVNVEHIVTENIARFPTNLQSRSVYELQNLMKGAIDSAIERVKRNYKTAVPQYYQGSVQLLLPLTLTDPTKADLALVVERFSDFYRAATCLTLDMAYNNARQLARPDRDWLVP
jgi:hypothetical protein